MLFGSAGANPAGVRLGLGRRGAAVLAGTLTTWAEAGQSAAIFPTFTFVTEDLAGWVAPPPDPEELPALREAAQVYDPAASPVSADLGYMPEYARQLPGAVRSMHPALSFAAVGPQAAGAVSGQPLHLPLGWRGPLGWLYRHGGAVLMLGTGLEAMTLLHLAETEAPVSYVRATWRRVRGPDGWVWFQGAPCCGRGFVKAAGVLERATLGRCRLGRAETIAADVRTLTELALSRLATDPRWLLCEDPSCPFCRRNRALLDGETTEILYGDATGETAAPPAPGGVRPASPIADREQA